MYQQNSQNYQVPQLNKKEHLMNMLDDDNSHLLQTDRKSKPEFMTQQMSHDINNPLEETIPKQKKKLNTQKIHQNGYLGQIVFESNYGKERQFRLYEDASLGLGQGCQRIIINQDWDEDIETDYSCADNAVNKCIRQLNVAVRHQKRGIDPTKPFIHDYSTVEERFQKENQLILNDKITDLDSMKDSKRRELNESPLIQSRNKIFSQMQNMMNSIDNQNNYFSHCNAQDLDQFMQSQNNNQISSFPHHSLNNPPNSRNHFTSSSQSSNNNNNNNAISIFSTQNSQHSSKSQYNNNNNGKGSISSHHTQLDQMNDFSSNLLSKNNLSQMSE